MSPTSAGVSEAQWRLAMDPHFGERLLANEVGGDPKGELRPAWSVEDHDAAQKLGPKPFIGFGDPAHDSEKATVGHHAGACQVLQRDLLHEVGHASSISTHVELAFESINKLLVFDSIRKNGICQQPKSRVAASQY